MRGEDSEIDSQVRALAPSEPSGNGGSRIQHFQAPVQTRTPYRRRYSDMSNGPHAEAILKAGFKTQPQERERKSLDEGELPSAAVERTKDLPAVVHPALQKRGTRTSLSAASGESNDTKGKRYAEMMERFQIRKISRSLSNSGNTLATLSGSAQSAAIVRGKTARELGDYPLPSLTPSSADVQGAASHRSTVPPIIPPLGSLSSRLEKAFTELGGPSESAALTPRDGTDMSRFAWTERSSRFSFHWSLVSWKRRIVRNFEYAALNISKPISPSSGFSRVRLATLILALTVHVVLFPLETAFLPEDARIDNGEAIEVVIELILLVDFALMFNTAFYTKRNQLVTSRRLIARHYVRTWFVPDLLSSVPVDLILMVTRGQSIEAKWLRLGYDVALRSQRVVHVVRLARVMWIAMLDSPERSIFEWLLYSRYSHLLRIAWIILCTVLFAHYLACGWRLLFISTPMRGTPLEEYVACFYDVLQLLQGQGVPTTTVAQNIYATVAILMGSIALAIIFGNVAILVSNFNANSTSYQRKMESIFAVMSKLQLPPPLRERIHQYYEHLWREYESLDGEIVAFSKGLSHTLELEVVLFKYMDLIMHVPFWRDGSPDFQKQLMLSLHVRVYLPDDFIIRRGEVGDEFFMINRGICELALGPDSFECTIDPLPDDSDSSFSEADANQEDEQMPKTARYELPTARRLDPPPAQGARGRRGSRPNVYSLGGPASARVAAAAELSSKYIQKLRRGQSFGEIALLMNYERTANVRALTYVEMCVLHRKDFQRILVKHPKDRKQVITNMLTKTMENNEATSVWCPLKATVHSVFGEGSDEKADNFSAMHAALLISNAVNLPLDDESIKFGIGVKLREQLVELRDKQNQRRESLSTNSASTVSQGSHTSAPVAPMPSTPSTVASAQEPTHLSRPTQPVESQQLTDHVKQLAHVQTDMSSTMRELREEVQSLRSSNEQLQRMLGTYEARLTELLRPAGRLETLSSSYTAPVPCLQPVKRRLSRKSSQGSLETTQQLGTPEAKPRGIPLTLTRSASMSSIHSARSIAVSCGTVRESQGADDSSDASQTDVARSTRHASLSAVGRSHTVKNLLATAQSGAAKPASLTNVHRPHPHAPHRGEPSRPSLNSRILMPLRSLLGPDASEIQAPQSPTKYADELFRDKSHKT